MTVSIGSPVHNKNGDTKVSFTPSFRIRSYCRQSRLKGFGSGALKVKGKIFAMKSSKGEFVVKLQQKRVAELVMNGIGTRFDPGHGRLMKEWLVIKASSVNWTDVAASRPWPQAAAAADSCA